MDVDILKFGGSSVANAESIDKVVSIIIDSFQNGPYHPVVVVSALGKVKGDPRPKVTDQLIAVAEDVLDGKKEEALEKLTELKRQHLDVIQELKLDLNLEDVFSDLRDKVNNPLSDFRNVGIAKDYFAGFGEVLASRIIASYLQLKGYNSKAVDAVNSGFITDSNFCHARLLDEALRNRIGGEYQRLAPSGIPKKCRAILVYTGFIGIDKKGNRTTLGRDGSNMTAVALGVALNAKRIFIYSDVDGVLRIEPEYIGGEVQTARILSHQELLELARGGVKVCQPESLELLTVKGRLPPIYFKNTSNPADPGTVVLHEKETMHSVMRGIGVIDNISYRVFPVRSIRQYRLICKCISNYHGAKILRSEVNDKEGELFSSFVIKKDPKPEFSKTHFESDLFHRIVDDAFSGKAPEGGFYYSNGSLVTIVGKGLGNSRETLAQIADVLANANITSDTLRSRYYRFPKFSGKNSVQLVLPTKDVGVIAKGIYNHLKRINLVLYGLGNVGQNFLERINNESEHLGINVVGVADRSGYVTRVGGLTPETVSSLLEQKKRKISLNQFSTTATGVYCNNKISLDEMLSNEKGDFIVVDATPDPKMLDVLYKAITEDAYVVSANKLPYISEDTEKVNHLLCNALDGKVLLRATVGADLGAPDTLIEILQKENPHSIEVIGCMSGTLGYLCDELSKGKKFSEAMQNAIDLKYVESIPYNDLSGTDVLNKSSILARLIASYYKLPYDKISINTHSFVKGIATPDFINTVCCLSKDEFAKKAIELDTAFSEKLSQLAIGIVPRYVAKISYDGNHIFIDTGLRYVSKDTIIGSLAGTDNIFLYGLNGKQPIIYFPQGPGAGVDVTVNALYRNVMKLVQSFREIGSK